MSVTNGYSFMGVVDSVAEEIPPRPWYAERYGYSLASVKGANGSVVIETLNYAIAEFIVKSVNERKES